ncbi:uncharacterized protein PHACADRAFT_201715 [Phanerochaete carnosa HHB-10118-sp]|uniref:Uncharacterized protein n=1 Tax=Phanerochaete carnosa (strain HHB-10118-sp) TaxID=650164 RepID=K5WGX0_PHACS|nr:uncharacterized protein PHACADRAFT_201715 [Phanerochaete carnosa HHB-10118-sp]EKM49452.1 hypothetical protein PHACADRAFT_201715 [Phanerochaete carnosa HHB-10118-sp]
MDVDQIKDDLLIAHDITAAPTSASQSHSVSLQLLRLLRELLLSVMVSRLLQARAVANANTVLVDDVKEDGSGEPKGRLCRIMEVLLGCAPVLRPLDFFDAGCHSLLASRLAFRI